MKLKTTVKSKCIKIVALIDSRPRGLCRDEMESVRRELASRLMKAISKTTYAGSALSTIKVS